MDSLLVDQAHGVRTLTLNRPEVRNAVNAELWEGLHQAFVAAGRDPAVRVVVVTGAGDGFCSGADLSGGPGMADPLTWMRYIGDAALALHRLAKPTIAKVNGVAAGAGANLALGCDLVVASDRARFCQIFSKRALSLDFGGSWLLPRLVGLQKAKELAFFAEMLGAEEARDIGIVNRVVPAAELDAFVSEWAGRLAAGPARALSLSKALLNASLASTMEEALEDEARAQSLNSGSPDTREAMRAFLEKRDPVFNRD